MLGELIENKYGPKFAEEIEENYLQKITSPTLVSIQISMDPQLKDAIYSPVMVPLKAQNLKLKYLSMRELKVIEPINVCLSDDNGKVVAESPELDVYGVGEDLGQAILELQKTIEELYFSLKDNQHKLGPHLIEIFSILNTKIVAEKSYADYL